MVEETTFDKLKKGLFEMLRGYPNYSYFGKIEYFLQDGGQSPLADTETALKVLKKHDIIEFASKEEESKLTEQLPKEIRAQIKASGKKVIWYRLASKGIDLAVSLMNVDYSKKITEYNEELSKYQKEILNYARETQEFNRRTQILTIIMVVLTAGLFIVGICQLFFKLPVIDILSFFR